MSKIYENYTYDVDEKDKTILTGTAVKKSKQKNTRFPACVKLGVGSTLKWKVGSAG